MSQKIIIQLAGQPGAGKTEVARHLVAKFDFTSILISDMLRNFAQSKNIELHERSDFTLVHEQLLLERGVFAVPDSILEQTSDLICVDGIRVPAYAERLKYYGSKIIALHCPTEERFARTLKRRSGLDKTSYVEFIRDEELESWNSDPFAQATRTVMDMADYHIDSSVELVSLLHAIDEIIVSLL